MIGELRAGIFHSSPHITPVTYVRPSGPDVSRSLRRTSIYEESRPRPISTSLHFGSCHVVARFLVVGMKNAVVGGEIDGVGEKVVGVSAEEWG